MRQKWSRLCFFVEKMEKMVLKNTNTTKRIIDHHSGIKKRVPSTALGVRKRIHHRLFSEGLVGHHHNQVAAATKKKLTSSRGVSSSSQAVSLFGEKKESTKGYVCILGVSLKAFKNVLAIFFHSCLGFWLWKTAIGDKKAKINRDWGQNPHFNDWITETTVSWPL